ncbi:hypothetical protein SAMN04489732_12027 [Amycolatopsis saalfeldensis]|uniref:Uncharacterized protein n=1 Tax=Amycolatopsis saalfeldensis TaxID=394193 RepID=A0A1H8YJI0_9PSEU|nr:hypothetical protein SAMN04489732_12027 [Amycolatopsis saalfeldensis]
MGRPGHSHRAVRLKKECFSVIVLGIILLVVGFIAKISILWTIGIVLLVLGAVLVLLGRSGRKVAGRAHWF